MGFKYERRLADGDDAGTFETAASENWNVGDTLIADGNRRYRVTAVLAPERLAEFLDGVEYGVLELSLYEPLNWARRRPRSAPDGTASRRDEVLCIAPAHPRRTAAMPRRRLSSPPAVAVQRLPALEREESRQRCGVDGGSRFRPSESRG